MRILMHIAAAGVAVIYFAGCAVQKEWAATGGSRADGVVELSFEYGKFQTPTVDDAQGVTIASATCAEWGYPGAKAFGGQTKVCNQPSGGGCAGWLVTKKYQCTGSPKAGH